MSWLIGCGYRPEFDRYATTKSGGQLLLSAGLLADSITELVDIYKAGPTAEYYYYPLMALLCTTLALNVVGICLSLVLGLQRYPTANPYQQTPLEITSTTNPGGEEATTQTTQTDKDTKDVGVQAPSKCPKSMKIMNDVLTVTTALVFILVATKSSIREGRDGIYRRCVNCTFVVQK